MGRLQGALPATVSAAAAAQPAQMVPPPFAGMPQGILPPQPMPWMMAPPYYYHHMYNYGPLAPVPYYSDPRLMEEARRAAGYVYPPVNVPAAGYAFPPVNVPAAGTAAGTTSTELPAKKKSDPEKTMEEARRVAGYVLPPANVPAAGTTSTELPAKKKAKHV